MRFFRKPVGIFNHSVNNPSVFPVTFTNLVWPGRMTKNHHTTSEPSATAKHWTLGDMDKKNVFWQVSTYEDASGVDRPPADEGEMKS